MGKLLLLIDGSSLAYRSHYAFVNKPLINSRGQVTSAVFGFTRSLKKVLEDLEYKEITIEEFWKKLWPEQVKGEIDFTVIVNKNFWDLI